MKIGALIGLGAAAAAVVAMVAIMQKKGDTQGNYDQDDPFQQNLKKTNPIAAFVAKEKEAGMDNASIINAALIKANSYVPPSYTPVETIDRSTKVTIPGSVTQTTSGKTTFTSYFAPGTQQIANRSGKNYADLGAGSDPSKW